MASATSAKRLVIAGVAAAAVLAAAADLAGWTRDARGNWIVGGDGTAPRFRILVGAVVAGVLLLLAADFLSPDLAAGFAVLILATTVVTVPVWENVAGWLGGS